MRALRSRVRYAIALVLLIVTISVSYAAYEKNARHQEELARWSMIASEFKNCEMFYALDSMGYTDPTSSAHRETVYNFDTSSELRQPLIDMLTIGVRNRTVSGIDQIWLDPSSIGSVENYPASETSINLLDQCTQSIKSGNLKVWLDVGIYYLVIGDQKKSTDWLNNAGAAGVPDAYVLLGHGYRSGLLTGVKDEGSAFINYTRAAEAGSIKGMLNVAEMVISVDPKSAIYYLQSAARKGSLTAAYRLTMLAETSVSSSSEKAAVGYFWALIFDALHNIATSRSLNDIVSRIREQRISSTILEQEIEYPLDGIPNKHWSGFKTSKARSDKTVRNYSNDDVTFMLQRYEKVLSPAQRIQIQVKVDGWMKKFNSGGFIDTIQLPEQKPQTSS